MHPLVRQIGPGSCPICGMALEPVVATGATGEGAELLDMTRRFRIGLVLTLPVVALEMGGHLTGLNHLLSLQRSNWLQLLLATPVAPLLFPAELRTASGAVPIYFEAAAVITILVLLGQVLELRARERTSGAIRALLDLAPKTAVRVGPDGADETVSLGSVLVGERLRMRPGEKVPVDGEVTEGRTAIDESMVTGGPVPVVKTTGSKVTGGTMNQTGGFVMRAEKVGSDTLLSRIVHMVAAAQRSRAPIQRMADRVAGWFVPVVILIAVASFIAWLAWGPSPAFSYALIAAVGVLIEPAAGFAADALIRAHASVERASEHPLAGAIMAEAQQRQLPLSPVIDFDSPVGKGVEGTVDGVRVVCGSAKFLRERRVDAGPMEAAAEPFRASAATVLFVALDGRLAGFVAVADPIKATTPEAIASLRREGIRVVMLTGDCRTTATAVGRTLGIDEVVAEVLPEAEAAVVQRLKAEGRVVAMAGDGVNDAPALAAAEVGIAMGTGTDVAIESAGVTLLRGDLLGIVRARRVSEATMRNIRRNLFFAFVYNAAGIPLAAGLLHPFFGVLLSPVGAQALKHEANGCCRGAGRAAGGSRGHRAARAVCGSRGSCLACPERTDRSRLRTALGKCLVLRPLHR